MRALLGRNTQISHYATEIGGALALWDTMSRVSNPLLYLLLFAGAYRSNPVGPVGKVTCHSNHTVDINITGVDDLAEWTETEWRTQNSSGYLTACQPTFHNKTVKYDGLLLPDCAFSSQQLPNSVKYILKISAKKSDPGATGQLYVYDHLYYVSCEYGNQNKTVASFVPVKNRQDNESSMSHKTVGIRQFFFYEKCVCGGWGGRGKREKGLKSPWLNKVFYLRSKLVTSEDSERCQCQLYKL